LLHNQAIALLYNTWHAICFIVSGFEVVAAMTQAEEATLNLP